MINKDMATILFNRNCCLIGNEDVVTIEVAEGLTSKTAVEFAEHMSHGGCNGYGNGEYTLMYITRKAFFLAVTHQNIEEYRKRYGKCIE